MDRVEFVIKRAKDRLTALWSDFNYLYDKGLIDEFSMGYIESAIYEMNKTLKGIAERLGVKDPVKAYFRPLHAVEEDVEKYYELIEVGPYKERDFYNVLIKNYRIYEILDVPGYPGRGAVLYFRPPLPLSYYDKAIELFEKLREMYDRKLEELEEKLEEELKKWREGKGPYPEKLYNLVNEYRELGIEWEVELDKDLNIISIKERKISEIAHV